MQVTSFLDPEIFPGTPNGRGEIEQGKNLVDAAKEAGVKFFVWRCVSTIRPSTPRSTDVSVSSLPSATTISGGKYSTVYHFDSKYGFDTCASFMLKISTKTRQSYSNTSKPPVFRAQPSSPDGFSKIYGSAWSFALVESLVHTQIARAQARCSQGDTLRLHHPDRTLPDNDLGPAVLSLIKNYVNPAAQIQGKAFPVTTARLTYPELARRISAGERRSLSTMKSH